MNDSTFGGSLPDVLEDFRLVEHPAIELGLQPPERQWCPRPRVFKCRSSMEQISWAPPLGA